MTSMTSFWCLIVDFKQVNAAWAAAWITLEYFQSCHKENLHNTTITSKILLKNFAMMQNVHNFSAVVLKISST